MSYRISISQDVKHIQNFAGAPDIFVEPHTYLWTMICDDSAELKVYDRNHGLVHHINSAIARSDWELVDYLFATTFMAKKGMTDMYIEASGLLGPQSEPYKVIAAHRYCEE